jgi:hypothetical protein
MEERAGSKIYLPCGKNFTLMCNLKIRELPAGPHPGFDRSPAGCLSIYYRLCQSCIRGGALHEGIQDYILASIHGQGEGCIIDNRSAGRAGMKIVLLLAGRAVQRNNMLAVAVPGGKLIKAVTYHGPVPSTGCPGQFNRIAIPYTRFQFCNTFIRFLTDRILTTVKVRSSYVTAVMGRKGITLYTELVGCIHPVERVDLLEIDPDRIIIPGGDYFRVSGQGGTAYRKTGFQLHRKIVIAGDLLPGTL